MAHGNLSDVLTPRIVAACADMEAAPTDVYRDALAFLAPFARRHGADAASVESLARVLLASYVDGADGPSMAAGAAVKASARWHGGSAARTNAELPAGDTRETLETLPASRGDDPARRYEWSVSDTLAALAALQGEQAGTILAALRGAESAWTSTGRPNVAALARTFGADTGRMRAALSDAVRDTLARCRADLPHVLAANDVRSTHKGSGGTLRDSAIPASGPASYVVRTGADGAHWAMLPTMSVRVDASGAAAVLADIAHAVPAYECADAARETDRPDPMRTAPIWGTSRRPTGVGTDIRSGSGAGTIGATMYADPLDGGRMRPTMAPALRPAAPSKRKRDGGIGSSMVTGQTSIGTTGRAAIPAPGSKDACACDVPNAAYCTLHDVRLTSVRPASRVDVLSALASVLAPTTKAPAMPLAARVRVGFAAWLERHGGTAVL